MVSTPAPLVHVPMLSNLLNLLRGATTSACRGKGRDARLPAHLASPALRYSGALRWIAWEAIRCTTIKLPSWVAKMITVNLQWITEIMLMLQWGRRSHSVSEGNVLHLITNLNSPLCPPTLLHQFLVATSKRQTIVRRSSNLPMVLWRWRCRPLERRSN